MAVLTTSLNQARDPRLAALTDGVEIDALLYAQEIRVQRAWAKALCKSQVLTADESQKIDQSLAHAHELMSQGKFDWRTEDEDVHMNLERFVQDETGLGKKMHLGRSRNDLISTTLKLHAADTINELVGLTDELINSLSNWANQHINILIPGMTHLQNGQPVRLSHVMLGHAWAFARDRDRLLDSKKRALQSMPLGSAALAGTTLTVDLAMMAQELGFERPSWNSYEAVGDRDAVVETLNVIALMAAHLARLAEDVTIWASAPVGLIQLHKAWSTGSSIMPNKRNPDVAELVRGKCALLIGDATGALALVKALPTSYGSDLHEIKATYLKAVREMKICLDAFAPFVQGLIPNEKRAQELLMSGHILATEIADHLAHQGTPFREAYAQVAALVELAQGKNLQVHELTENEAIILAPRLQVDFLKSLTFESAVEKRRNDGGTSKAQVLKQIQALKELAGKESQKQYGRQRHL